MCDEWRDIEYDEKKLKEEKCPKCGSNNKSQIVRVYDGLAFKCNNCGKQWTDCLSQFAKNYP